MVQQTILISLPLEDLQEVIHKAVTQAIQNQQPQTPLQESDTEYYTRRQTAEKLHISLGTLDSYTKLNILTACKIGHRVLYLKSDIDSALSQKINTPKHKRGIK